MINHKINLLKSIRNVLVVVLPFILAEKGQCQQAPIFSQYTFNKFIINPATAGIDNYTTISLVAREQWIGFKGTPKTHSLSIDSRILNNSYIAKEAPVRKKRIWGSRSGRVGWAANIFNDHTGPLDKTGIAGTYSYHIRLSNSLLSFGLTGIFYQFRINKDKIDLGDEQYDQLVDGTKGRLYIPDADFGAFYTRKDIYGGISVKQLFQSSIQFGDKGDNEYRYKRQYNFMAGYFYTLNSNFIIEPSLLLKIPTSSKPQLDLTAKVYFKEDYWTGITFRTGASIAYFFGVNYDRYFFGYAFDYNFNKIMGHTFGTHEFMATAKFGENARRYKWLNTY